MTGQVRHAVAVAALLAGACSSGDDMGAAAAAVDESEQILSWVHETPGNGEGEGALIAGVLAYDDATRCLYLDTGTGRHPVVWPYGTELTDSDPVRLRLRHGDTVEVGDHVEGGGGYLPAETLFDLGIPEACLGEHREVARFNQDDRPTILPGP